MSHLLLIDLETLFYDQTCMLHVHATIHKFGNTHPLFMSCFTFTLPALQKINHRLQLMSPIMAS